MQLSAQIRQTIQTLRTNFSPEFNALIEQGAGAISALEIVEKALKSGDQAPDFSLETHRGEIRTLFDYLKEGPLVLTFYRGLWCPYCNLHLKAYNEHLADIKATGANLVAVSPEKRDSGYEALMDSEAPPEFKGAAVRDVGFDVLYDAGNSLAQKYGLAFELPETHKQLMGMLNFDIEKANGDRTYAFADPATYVIGQDSIIQWAYVPNNYRKRAEPEAIIAQLKTL
ncbi:MAG: peroxiredoxin-like family protein [Cyanobacteria bacterium J06639_14]